MIALVHLAALATASAAATGVHYLSVGLAALTALTSSWNPGVQYAHAITGASALGWFAAAAVFAAVYQAVAGTAGNLLRGRPASGLRSS